MRNLAKKIAFATIVFMGLIVSVEMGLRATMPNLEEVVSPLLYQRNSGQSFTPGKAPNSRVYVSGRRRTVLNKKQGVRILVFGASAAYGEMFSSFTAFPGQAEHALQRANPSIPVEVLNLAHGGMGSRQVGEMAFRALENDNPDLIVIYTGNNEYHELRALKARSKTYDPSAELMRRRLSKSFMYRKVRDLIRPVEGGLTPPDGEKWLPIGRLDVTVDEQDRALGLALYQDHLRSIILAARERGIPVLLTTVATNVRDHIDNGTPGQATEAEVSALHALEGMVDRLPKSEFVSEARRLSEDVNTEGGLHRLGQLYLRAKVPEMASDAFERKELVTLRPMTSNRAMRNAVVQLGQNHSTRVCDLASSLASNSSDGIPGNDVFIDHCHPNAAGHKILGEALSKCILNMGIAGLEHANNPPKDEPAHPLRIDHYSGHRHIPGFKTNPIKPDLSTVSGVANSGHQAFVNERFDDALAAYRQALDMSDPTAHLHHTIGLTQLYRGDLEAARKAFDEAILMGLHESKWMRQTLGP